MDMPRILRASFVLTPLLILISWALTACETSEKRGKDSTESVQIPASPTPTATLDPVEAKYKSKYPSGPTPTPMPLDVRGYGVEPTNVLYRDNQGTEAQLIVFFNTIIYEPLPDNPVVLLHEGRPAKNIEEKGVGLFEAQDLLYNFRIGPDTPAGFYDARVRVKEKTYFLENVFEIR
jgi:hypothetical protein